MKTRILALVLAVTLPWAALGKSKNPKDDPEAIGERDIGKGVNLYSLEKEIAIGRQLAAEVEKTAKIVDDPVISEYVNRIGQNLVRNSDAKVPFTIKVIDNDEVNAFALPGGFFFVNTGIIRLAENEAELAGVMAHEIAHVAARHGTRQASRAQITNILSIPLIFVGGGVGYAVSQAAGLAIPLTFLKFSRGFEEEADALGVQYLYKSGYDPQAMVTFFERLQAQEKKKPGTLAKVFSSHPITQDRAKNVQEAINENLSARPEYAINTSEFEEVKQHLVRLEGRRKESTDPNRPTLRRKSTDGTIPAGGETSSGEENEEDERPTLKRR
jgi:predicted Zn-dependent protease